LTPQEEQLLDSLVERVNQTQLQEKDPDAEALLNKSLGPNPDALYILAQTVLVQNIALEQGKAQVAQLQEQAQQSRQPARATSFLGSLLGHRDPDPPEPPAQPAYQSINPQYVQPQYAQPQYAQPAPPPLYAQPQYQQPQYVSVSGGQPSFLRGAMQTAAGVAAGALAFEGVESVLHGLGGHPGWGGGGFGAGPMMGGGFDRPVEETVVNNYYDDPNAQGGERLGSERGGFDQGSERHFHESSDQGNAHFNDASYNTAGDDRNEIDSNNADDPANFDNSGFENSNMDDGSGFDDGGGGSDNSGGDLL
jgi:hypothetical protein